MKVFNQRLLILMIVVGALFAGGCGTTSKREPSIPRWQLLAEQAEAVARQNDYAQAAMLYRSAADAADRRQAHLLRLEAAGMLLDAGNTAAAEKLLGSLPEKADDEQARNHRAVAEAVIAFRQSRFTDAADRLAGVDVTATGQLQRRWLELHAKLLAERGEYRAAARDRTMLEPYLSGEVAIRNREALWQLLEKLDVEALESQPVPPDQALEGWMSLVAIAKRYAANGGALIAALGTWADRFPDHPGMLEYHPRLKDLALALGTRPKHVAVLLPQDGPFAKAGNAVRDGILAAWLGDAPQDRPRLTFFAESTDTLWENYAVAVKEGAEFVIGPLSKEAVTMVSNTERMPLPTLALNYLEAPAAGSAAGPPPEQLFQFGLSPESEAREVALRAWFDGHQQALVLYPDSPWGTRVGEAFTAEWMTMGGVVDESRAYGRTPNEMSDAVADLVNVDESDRRGRTLRGILARKLETEPRPRQDAQFVFMAATSGDARQLRPQLRFHRAGDLPVYSLSHVYTGTMDAAVGSDLDGIRFADMPWMISDQFPGSEIKQTLARYWPERMVNYGRLYALGVDAYRLVGELQQMNAWPATRVDGATGRMGLDPQRRVHRELTWAEFHDGQAVLLDTPNDIPNDIP